jgi:hypothetical protein
MMIPATATSAAPGDAALTVVHGLQSAGAVDVYVDGGLVSAALGYGENFAAELPGGTYTVEICGADVEAPNPLPDTGCEFNVDFPNSGVELTVANNTSYTVVAQYAGLGGGEAPGRPTVVAYVNDLTCVEPGQGRISFLHAAAAPTVDALFDGTVVFDAVAPETTPPPSIERAGGTVDIDMIVQTTEGDEQLLSFGLTSLPIRNSSAAIFVGNPQFEASYDLLSVDYAVTDCVPETTTTTSTTAPSTTTTTAVPRPVAPVAATPRFTG